MQRPGITRERLVALCFLGVLLFSPSMISLFDQGADATFFGIPVLVLYLFGSWAALILMAYVMIRHRSRTAQPPPQEED